MAKFKIVQAYLGGVELKPVKLTCFLYSAKLLSVFLIFLLSRTITYPYEKILLHFLSNLDKTFLKFLEHDDKKPMTII